MLTLIVHHNIFLTSEERYALHLAQTMDCMGVASVVWLSEEKTTEPAKEIFCRYVIKNMGEQVPIQLQPYGFDIVLPYKKETNPTVKMTLDEWRELTKKEKDGLSKFYLPGDSSKQLLDIKDGGSGGMMYREKSKIVYDDNQVITVIHLVQIRPIEDLKSSLTFKTTWSEGNPSARP